MSLQQKVKNIEGFTLVEIVLIIVVVGIAIPALMMLLSSNLTNSTKSEYATQAVIYAQEKLNELIADKRNPNRGYNWVVTANRYTSDVPATGYSRSVLVDTSGYVQNGVSYAFVQVKVSHSEIPEIVLTTWLTNY